MQQQQQQGRGQPGLTQAEVQRSYSESLQQRRLTAEREAEGRAERERRRKLEVSEALAEGVTLVDGWRQLHSLLSAYRPQLEHR